MAFEIFIICIFFQDIPNDKLNQRTVDIDFESNKVSEIKIIPPSIPIERLSLRKNNISSIRNGAFEALTYTSYIDHSKPTRQRA